MAVLSKRQTNVVFVAILLGMLLAALDQTIVSTALPTIVGKLGGLEHAHHQAGHHREDLSVRQRRPLLGVG